MHHIIFSHGFGVRRDDRGLFTDIASALPSAQPIMFDYNIIDDAANTITVPPLDDQAARLTEVINAAREQNPSATIDLICHSQGCAVAALAAPNNVRKTIFLAPPVSADIEPAIRSWQAPGATFDTSQNVLLQRRDGTTTIVPPSYWPSIKRGDAQTYYNVLAKKTQLTIFTATNDEVLGKVHFDHLAPNITVTPIKTDHNFRGDARQTICQEIASIIGE